MARIKLIHHVSGEHPLELAHDARGLRWTQLSGFVAAAEGRRAASVGRE